MTFGLRCSQPARRPHPASLPIRVPTVEGLLRASFSFPLQLSPSVAPCVSLRLSSSTPSSSFHLDRFCPCWAHWGGPLVRGRRPRRPFAARVAIFQSGAGSSADWSAQLFRGHHTRDCPKGRTPARVCSAETRFSSARALGRLLASRNAIVTSVAGALPRTTFPHRHLP